MSSPEVSPEKSSTIKQEFVVQPSMGISSLNRDVTRSAFSPYRPSTVLTNLQRGNVQTQTPSVATVRSIHQLAAQGELLVQNLSDCVDMKDEEDLTPLMWASKNGQLATVRLLIKHKACPSSVGKQGQNALLFASANGHVTVVKELLEHDVDIDAKDVDGNTALMYAAFGNHAQCAQELLLAGCDFTVQNKSSETAYSISISKRSKQVQCIMEKHMLKLIQDG